MTDLKLPEGVQSVYDNKHRAASRDEMCLMMFQDFWSSGAGCKDTVCQSCPLFTATLFDTYKRQEARKL